MLTGQSGPSIGFIKGAGWACLAALSFAVMMTSVRYLDGKFDAFEIVFIRAVVGVIIIIPLILRSGFASIKTNRLPIHLLRTILALMAMATLYYALVNIAVAEAVALTFLIPLFTTILAGLVLRERVAKHRWAATVVGFIASMLIIRPSLSGINISVILAILSSALYAGAWATVKVLTRTDTPAAIVFWMNVLMLPLTVIPLFWVWVSPRGEDVIVLFIMALSGWLAHFCQAKSFEKADVSAVMPFDFLRLPIAAFFGYFLFYESTDAWTWVGAIIIFSSGYYITRRESVKCHR
tara:strand:+ start:3668 stop:4549 length:882 start_codon:yes stop_codon:yes gene_type:complete